MKKILKKSFFLAVAFFSVVFTFIVFDSVAGEKTKVRTYVFIRPDSGKEAHPFFDEFEAAMRAAVNSLGDKLVIRYSNTDHFKMIEEIRSAAASEPKPDTVVFMAMRNNGEKALAALEEAGVDGFIVNAGLTQDQYAKVGEPRTEYKHWLGEMLPDDVGAGRILAEELYEQAIAANPSLIKEKGVKMFAIEANAGDGASVLRAKGLQAFAESQKNLELLQIVKGQWEQTKAKELTAFLLDRHKQVNVIWAASDAMAQGAFEAVKEKGLIPGKDVFIGGVDWSQSGLSDIEGGRLNASAGGHILEGAWAAVVLHDYYNGHDFAEQGTLRMNSPMYIADKENLSSIRDKMGVRNWDKFDFTKFSKAFHPEIKTYNFSLLSEEKL